MSKVEEAILKTLIYADLFDFALTREELRKYLIAEKVSLDFLNEKIERLLDQKKIQEEKGYLSLSSRKELSKLRLSRANISRTKIKKAQKKLGLLKLNPFLKMVAITGALAMENSSEEDDIDLMFIFKKNRLFLGRLCEFLILKLLGQRRKPGQKEARDTFCPNLYLTEDCLKTPNQDLYTAHEIIQVKPVWNRGGVHEQFLFTNNWISEYLPNFEIPNSKKRKRKKTHSFSPLNLFENLARNFQLKYMEKKISQEKISADALFFHPEDKRGEILQKYQKALSKYLK